MAPPRSRRSHTNLSNLRLAPLSTDFSFPPPDDPSPSTSPTNLAVPPSYQTHHVSYIQGRSAPSTPGILARSSSRSRQDARLSRQLSLYSTADDEYYSNNNNDHGINPIYAGVRVNKDGVALSALRGEPGMAIIPKSKSDAALLAHQRRAPNIPALGYHQRSFTSAGTSGSNVGKKRSKDDDWLTRAGLTTSSLLRESKGHSSWLTHSSHSTHPSLSLPDTHSFDFSPSLSSHYPNDNDNDPNIPPSALHSPTWTKATPSAHSRRTSSVLRLHFADDEFSPETPRGYYNDMTGTSTGPPSRWGSRFGSRAPSARTSRRGSRSDLWRTTPGASSAAPMQPGEDYFARFAPVVVSGRRAVGQGQGQGQQGRRTQQGQQQQKGRKKQQGGDVSGPDFVDLGEEEEYDDDDDEGGGDEDEDAEEEVARLARERGFGLGGLVDRLVGWSLFNVDEDGTLDSERETPDDDDVEDEQLRRGGREGTSVVGEAEAILRANKRAQRTGVHVSANEEADEGRRSSIIVREENNGWRDAAWLLSVASRVIL